MTIISSKHRVSTRRRHGDSNVAIIVFKLFRILLFGIVRTIRPLGPLNGLLGGRFILAFLSVLFLVLAKGLFLADVVDPLSLIPLSISTMLIGLQFVPQLILACFTTIGFSWNSAKLIAYHPETLLLSAGTLF